MSKKIKSCEWQHVLRPQNMKTKNDESETNNKEKVKNHLYCNSMIVGKEKEEKTQ